ncbi:hypothetical protein [Kingella oralis]|uniref:hypothetical protein n=1 Tax=Kingella oralis TaxID=505 RepID=UPI0034E45C6A
MLNGTGGQLSCPPYGFGYSGSLKALFNNAEHTVNKISGCLLTGLQGSLKFTMERQRLVANAC